MSRHDDAAKEHNPERVARTIQLGFEPPGTRRLVEFKNCVSDRFGPGQPGSQSQPADGGEMSKSQEPRLWK
jgi:hypothetical protein